MFGQKGAGVRFLTDHCLKAILCPSTAEQGPEWWVVNTALLTSGRHALAVNLGAGSTVERIRIERKKDADADYVATLRRLGFDVGPEGRVSRPKAIAAMEWVAARRRESARVGCGDVAARERPADAGRVPGAGHVHLRRRRRDPAGRRRRGGAGHAPRGHPELSAAEPVLLAGAGQPGGRCTSGGGR